MKWSAVLMFFACTFLTSDGFSLNYDLYLKSNDIVPDTSPNLVKFDKNLVKINSNGIINKNEIENKFERNEENKSTEEDSDEVYYYDEDDNGDDDDDDDDEDEVVDEEDDNDEDNEDRAEDEVDDNKDEDVVSKYVYDYFNDKNIHSEESNKIKYETELLRVTRGYVFESSEDRTKLIPRYNDTNYNTNNDDNGRDNQRSYSYNKVKYQDNDTEDDRSDNDDDSERNTHEEDWPALEDGNGARAVADYVVDYVKTASSHEKDGNPRCLFGWHLDANGVCAPRRQECGPGLVRNAEGNCVGPDTGYWYK